MELVQRAPPAVRFGEWQPRRTLSSHSPSTVRDPGEHSVHTVRALSEAVATNTKRTLDLAKLLEKLFQQQRDNNNTIGQVRSETQELKSLLKREAKAAEAAKLESRKRAARDHTLSADKRFRHETPPNRKPPCQ